MTDPAGAQEPGPRKPHAWLGSMLPGVALSALIAVLAVLGAPVVAKVFPIPAMVIALLIGIALNPFAHTPRFQPGIVFCLKTILRWAVALLGLRIALGDITALGLTTALLVIVSMAVTVATGFLCARMFGQQAPFGALAGAGTAVCGASATLATAIVVPDYKGKEADVAFVVVAVNALSTVAMVLYPIICSWLGFDPQVTGVMLGATIHDVAQVVGAGYAVSDAVGNTAVIVKLFRVFLLFPVVHRHRLVVRRRSRDTAAQAKFRFPVFALVFVALTILNSIAGIVCPDRAGLRADQGAADRGLDLGPADRDLGARSRHLAAGDCRAGLASRRHRDDHHPGDPVGGDGGIAAAALTAARGSCAILAVDLHEATSSDMTEMTGRAFAMHARRRRARARRPIMTFVAIVLPSWRPSLSSSICCGHAGRARRRARRACPSGHDRGRCIQRAACRDPRADPAPAGRA